MQGRHFIRAVTFNIRRFTDEQGLDAVAPVLEALKRLLPIDILALQEVDTRLRPDALSTISTALELPHYKFWGHVRDVYGNALFCSSPLRASRPIHLNGGTLIKLPDGRTKRIVRGLLTADTEFSSLPLRIAVTHLDHMAEAQRRIQVPLGPPQPPSLHFLPPLNAHPQSCRAEAVLWGGYVAGRPFTTSYFK